MAEHVANRKVLEIKAAARMAKSGSIDASESNLKLQLTILVQLGDQPPPA